MGAEGLLTLEGPRPRAPPQLPGGLGCSRVLRTWQPTARGEAAWIPREGAETSGASLQGCLMMKGHMP